MANKRIFALVALVALAILTGCELQSIANDPNYVPSAIELTRLANEMPEGELKLTVQSEGLRRFSLAQEAQGRADAAQAVANAAAQEAAQHIAIATAVARATGDALAARATAQALDANLTRQAQNYRIEETRQAQAFADNATRQAGYAIATAQASAATATAQSIEGTRQSVSSTRQAVAFIASQTAQAVAYESTREAVAFSDAATRVSIQATITRVAWEGQTERIVRPILTGAGIITLVALAGGGFYLAWKFSQVLEDRARIFSPAPDRGEPIIAIQAGQYMLPYRTVNPVTTVTGNDVDSPVVAPSVAAQMRVTLGQQKANYAQARQVSAVARAVNRVPNFVKVSSRMRFAQPGGAVGPGDNGQPWADVTPNWPHQVRLESLFSDKRPSLSHIIIGVAPRSGGAGGLDVISSNLDAMMHTLLVGSSGWGKSTWLRAFLWQIEKAPEPVQVVAMDISGSELNALGQWEKLRYPVARTVGDAVGVLGEVGAELERRRRLFEGHPEVSKLSEYNALGGEPLAPWVVVCDEAAALLNDKSTGDPLRTAVQTSRQYGIYAVLATVSASATIIPTALRDQFSTRIAFRTNSATSSRVVIEDGGASRLTVKGRALLQRGGDVLKEVQAPFLGRGEFVRSMCGDGPQLALPDAILDVAPGDSREARILELLLGNDMSDTAIARVVYGHGNTHYIEKVRTVKAKVQQQQNDNDNGQE